MSDESEELPHELLRHPRANIDLEGYDPEELNPPDWITNLDREILALLGVYSIILTPALIAKNIDRPRSSISRRLSTLEAGGMVEKVERGHYRITSEGYARMEEAVPVEAPESAEEETRLRVTIPTPQELEELEENGILERES